MTQAVAEAGLASSSPAFTFRIARLPQSGFAAEVLDIDLAQPLDDNDVDRLHKAHLDHHVVVYRKQHITPAQQVAFSRRFGLLQKHVLAQFALPDQPEVLVVSNIRENGQPIGLGDAGHYWHSDLSYKKLPSLGSFLHAQELPRIGGDTLFADMHAAWDALPLSLKKAVEGKRAHHSYLKHYADLQKRSPWRPDLTAAQLEQLKPVSHPVVRTHPETGRRALFVSEHFTTHMEGLPEDEGNEILQQLFDHSVLPQFVYRHRWQPHDMVFWDNRSVMHLASGCPDEERRKLYRTTVEGDEPW